MTEEPILTIRTERTPDANLVRCSGRLVSSNAELLKAEVKPLISRGGRIVIDLSDVTFMDSMGLGTVAALYVSSKTAGCTFVLVNLSRRIRDLFSVTHLLSLFESCGETNAIIP